MRAPTLAASAQSQSLAVRRSCQHDGIGERLAGRTLPHDRRLALIGDADRSDRLHADVA